MKGLKWRAYNVGTARIGELVGAQAVTIQAAELPQALATGVVNSFMSSGATGYDCKVWETLTHFYDTQAWIPKNVTFVNKAAFDALDKPTQEAVLKAAAAAEERGWKIVAGQDRVVSRPAQGQGHEGAAAEPGARGRLQEDRRAAHRRLAQEGRRRRPGDGRRLQEDVRRQSRCDATINEGGRRFAPAFSWGGCHMQYVRLGSTGVKVSRLVLGTMTWGDRPGSPGCGRVRPGRLAIKAALDAGINFFDTADVYSNGESERDCRTRAQGFRQARRNRAGDQGVPADGTGAEPEGPFAQADHGIDRRLAQAARHRLCRSLHHPSLRP